MNTFLCKFKAHFTNRSNTEIGCRYSVYVLEASTSNRLTYFLPPL